MKCPLSNYVMERESGEDEVLLSDCLTEECAWWSRDEPECIIQTIDYRLGAIAHFLGSIAKELTLRGK